MYKLNEAHKVLTVDTVKPGSPAAELGIQPGDVVRAYNNVPISSNTALSSAAFNAREKQLAEVPLVLGRGLQKLRLKVPTESLGIECTETVVHDRFPGQAHDTSDPDTHYDLARVVATVVSLVGVVLIAVGAFVAISAIVAAENARYGGITLLIVLPGLGTAVTGLLLVMGAQVTRATVDTADHTREILQLATDSTSSPVSTPSASPTTMVTTESQ